MGSARNVFFIIVFTFYIASILASATVMLLIYLDTALHKPMFIFLFTLILNGIIGSSAVWPQVMNILITDDNTSSYTGCLIQVFLISVYGGCNFTMLTVMAYDRYVFIFKPLQYHTIMNPQMVRKLILVSNLIPVITVLAQTCLNLKLSLCSTTIHRIFCDSLSIVDLSCYNNYTVMCSLFGVCATFCLGLLPVFFIILSYFKIISIILTMSADARWKTFTTCSPHLIIFLLFSFVSLFSVIFNRLYPDIPSTASVIRAFFIAPNYILFPPFLQPVIYGFKTQEIRQSFLKFRKRTIFS